MGEEPDTVEEERSNTPIFEDKDLFRCFGFPPSSPSPSSPSLSPSLRSILGLRFLGVGGVFCFVGVGLRGLLSSGRGFRGVLSLAGGLRGVFCEEKDGKEVIEAVRELEREDLLPPLSFSLLFSLLSSF